MAIDDLHELTAAFALDALDADDRAAYEAHLASCERCREELAAFEEAAAQLAYGTPAPAPPPRLRARVLDAVRADGGVVRGFRPRRRALYALGAVAAAASAVAIGLGIWTARLAGELDAERSALAVLADADARILPLQGANGRLVVTKTGTAALVVAGLPTAPRGKTYEIWVIDDGEPSPAGLFDGGDDRTVVRLSRPVPPDAQVAVTVERDGGADAPTSTPIFGTRT